MRIPKRYITSTLVVAGVLVLVVAIDLITPDKPTYFNLHPGFKRITFEIKLSESRKETPDSFQLECLRGGDKKRVYDGIVFNRYDELMLNVTEDLTQPIYITVRSKAQKVSYEGTDPVLIIKSSDGKISICQDYDLDKTETLHSEEKSFWQRSIPKGTYFVWIGDYEPIKDPYYQIEISEED